MKEEECPEGRPTDTRIKTLETCSPIHFLNCPLLMTRLFSCFAGAASMNQSIGTIARPATTTHQR